MSNLLARSALVDSTFLMLVAFSVTGNKLGVNTIAKLRASILFESDELETSDKNRIRQDNVAACKGGNKRQAVKTASILASPVNLQHLKKEINKGNYQDKIL